MVRHIILADELAAGCDCGLVLVAEGRLLSYHLGRGFVAAPL
ncbi:MAG: hypothetical protein AB7I38_03180 [Dehalococcoidia bacterium]